MALPCISPSCILRGCISSGSFFTESDAYADILALNPYISSQAPASSRPVQPAYVASFDGVDDYMKSGELIREGLDVTIVFKINSSDTSVKAIFGGGSGSARFYAQYTSYAAGTLHVIIGGYLSGDTGVNQLTGVATGVWHTLRMKSDGDWWFNGVYINNTGTSITATTSNTDDNFLHVGRRGISTGTHRNINVCHFSVIDDGVLSSQYNFNHKSGTTAFDSSGNGNDVTLMNGAVYAVDNTLPKEADKLNLEGYTDDGGVLKPRDESNPSLDIDWNPLQYTGSVYPVQPVKRDSYCGNFDGVDDYIAINSSDPSGRGSAWIWLDNVTKLQQGIFSYGNTVNDGYIYISNNELKIIGGDTVISMTHSTVLTANKWIFIEWNISEGESLSLAIDGVEETGGVMGVVPVHSYKSIGCHYSRTTNFFVGKMFAVTCEFSEYVFSEGKGQTIHDVSGNDNHGTVNNASTAAEGAGFWAGRQDEYHSNLENGFSYGVDGETRIPALADSSGNAADGSGSLTNPAISGGYNDAETQLDAYKIAEGDNPCPASNGHSDLEVIGFDEDLTGNDSAYMRLKSSVVNDRLLVFSEDLTGSEKTMLENYTS